MLREVPLHRILVTSVWIFTLDMIWDTGKSDHYLL